MTKVLFIFPEYTYGGAEIQFGKLLTYLEIKAVGVDVIVTHTHGFIEDSALNEAKSIFKHISFQELFLHNCSNSERIAEITEFIKRDKEKTRYSVAIFYDANFIPIIPSLVKAGIKTVYCEQCDGIGTVGNIAYRECLKVCDVVTANSMHALRNMEKVIKRKVRYIPTAISIDKYTFMRQRRKDIKNILVPARIEPLKNQLFILRMIAAHKDESFYVRFAGHIADKAYFDLLTKYIKDEGIESKVLFAGYVSNIEDEYRNTDLIILPSLSEGLPNVVLESFAYGKPIIVSDIEAEKELVTESSLRFSLDNTDSLYNCVKFVKGMTDEKYNSMLQEQRVYVEKNHSDNVIMNKYLQVIKIQNIKDNPMNDVQYALLEAVIESSYEKEKMFFLYSVLAKWVNCLQSRKKVSRYFADYRYSKVIIYGYKELGQLLHQSLVDSEIKVVAIVDKSVGCDVYGNKIQRPENVEVYDADVVVVTAVSYFNQIYNMVSPKCSKNTKIVSIDEIISYLNNLSLNEVFKR